MSSEVSTDMLPERPVESLTLYQACDRILQHRGGVEIRDTVRTEIHSALDAARPHNAMHVPGDIEDEITNQLSEIDPSYS